MPNGELFAAVVIGALVVDGCWLLFSSFKKRDRPAGGMEIRRVVIDPLGHVVDPEAGHEVGLEADQEDDWSWPEGTETVEIEPTASELFMAGVTNIEEQIERLKKELPVDRSELAERLGSMLNKYTEIAGGLVADNVDDCEQLSGSCQDLFNAIIERFDAVQCFPAGAAGEQSLFIESRAIMASIEKSFEQFLEKYAEIIGDYSDPADLRATTFAALIKLAGKIYLSPAFVVYQPPTVDMPLRQI